MLNRLADLRCKEVVNVCDGARLGFVADVVIDFSRPETLEEVYRYVRRTGTPLVSGTTGYTDAQMARLKELAEFAPVLWSANYSLGVAVFVRALQAVSEALCHHRFYVTEDYLIRDFVDHSKEELLARRAAKREARQKAIAAGPKILSNDPGSSE